MDTGARMTLLGGAMMVFATTAAEAAVNTKKVPAKGGTGTISYRVTLGAESAAFPVEVQTSAGGWLKVDAPPPTVALARGKGTLKFRYSIDPQLTAASRTGVLSVKIGDAAPVEVLAVAQAGVPCKIDLSSNKTTLAYYGGTAGFTYTVPEGCRVDVTADPWIGITSGEGSVALDVALLDDTTRTGKIILTASATADLEHTTTDRKTHTVVQNKRQPVGTMRIGRPTAITPANIREAAASVVLAAKMIAEGGDKFSLADVSLGSRRGAALSASGHVMPLLQSGLLARISAQRADSSDWCPDGGTYEEKITDTVFSETYDGCRNGVVETTGRIAGTRSFNVRTGIVKGSTAMGTDSEPFVMKVWKDTSYTTLRGVTTTVMAMKIDSYKKENDLLSFSVSNSGYVLKDDLDGEKRQILVEAKDFRTKFIEHVDGYSLQADGALRTTGTVDKVLTSSQELVLDGFDIETTRNSKDESIGIDGSYSVTTYPGGVCTDGTFNVSGTFTYGYNGRATGGTINVNGTDVAIAPEGTATAEISGDAILIDDINGTCPMGDWSL